MLGTAGVRERVGDGRNLIRFSLGDMFRKKVIQQAVQFSIGWSKCSPACIITLILITKKSLHLHYTLHYNHLFCAKKEEIIVWFLGRWRGQF